MHGRIMIGATAFRAFHKRLTFLGEVRNRRTAFETYSFLFEEGLSVVKEFVSEWSEFFQGVWFIV